MIISVLPAIGTVKLVDSLLAGLALWMACATLGLVEARVSVPLFAPPMMASGIIFSISPTPPHPKGFLSGTICSATFSLAVFCSLRSIFPQGLDHGVVAQGAAAGALLVWYKLTATVFPPAVVLASTLVASAVVSSDQDAITTVRGALWALCFPWLAGHAWIYAWAYGASKVRGAARVALSKRSLAALGTQTDDALKDIFDKFDTSGDGALDADELTAARCAWRSGWT